MKNQLPVIACIEELGDIVEVNNDFFTELQQLNDSGAKLISPRDEAYARLNTRAKENIGTIYGTRTTGGFEYARGQLPIFRVNSRLVDSRLAKSVVEANKLRNYFNTSSTEEYEYSLRQAEKDMNKEPRERDVVVLPSRDAFTISDIDNWDIYEAALKDQAKPYFEYNGPITFYPLAKDVIDSHSGTIMCILWFRGFDGGSLFYGYSRNLNHDDRARGIVVKNSELSLGGLNNLYSSEQIGEYLHIVREVKAGRIDVSELEKLANFLQSLK